MRKDKQHWLSLMYKHGDDTIEVTEYIEGSGNEVSKQVPIKTDSDGMIFCTMPGDLWLWKKCFDFYPSDIHTIKEFEKLMEK